MSINKLLTIGMATYDDFDGVYFTIQALRLYHPICNSGDVEIIVIDNNPNSNHGATNKQFISWVKNGRYIPYTLKTSTAVRNEIFKQAQGKYCISMDCHVLLCEGAIEALLKYYEVNPDCKNIVQGPLVYDHLDFDSASTHFNPCWDSCMYGKWATNHEKLNEGKPFEIPMQGLGVFSCETKNWVGFNKHFRGFGGEEGYIHEKFRQFGGKAICHPEFTWVHRFNRPNGVKYPLILEDRIWNYFVGWLELTQDPNHTIIQEIYNHFKDKIPTGSIDNIFQMAKNKILI
jgi:hypothetical protein